MTRVPTEDRNLVSLPEDKETIAAISTATGVGAIGVVRISGSDALSVADRVFTGSKMPSAMQHATLQFGKLVDEGNLLDEVVLSVMRAPRSYTGDDTVEISCHGNPLVLKSALEAVVNAGARLATGGEFTRRSFLNGKMDLCQAEAVIELLMAETEEGRRVALSQIEGATSHRISTLRTQLIGVKAHLDALIDFPDDLADEAEVSAKDGSDVTNEPGAVQTTLQEVASELETMLAAFEASQRLQKQPNVVILGKANVGKSTILNALAGQDRAITSETPGTTRDRVDAECSLPSGRSILLNDTAGFLIIQTELDEKARAKMEEATEAAEVALVVLDSSAELEPRDTSVIERAAGLPAIVVLNKIDLDERLGEQQVVRFWPKGAAPEVVRTSALTGEGVERLKLVIDDALGRVLPEKDGNRLVVGTVRNSRLLSKTLSAVRRAVSTGDDGAWPELVSQDLAEAIAALDELMGIDVSVDILDEVFSRFCIGK